jgi:hypothetical protein
VFTSTHLHATNQDGTSHFGAMVLQGQNSKLAEAFLLQRPFKLCQLSAAFHSSDIIEAWSSLAVRGRYVTKTFSLSDGGLWNVGSVPADSHSGWASDNLGWRIEYWRSASAKPLQLRLAQRIFSPQNRVVIEAKQEGATWVYHFILNDYSLNFTARSIATRLWLANSSLKLAEMSAKPVSKARLTVGSSVAKPINAHDCACSDDQLVTQANKLWWDKYRHGCPRTEQNKP